MAISFNVVDGQLCDEHGKPVVIAEAEQATRTADEVIHIQAPDQVQAIQRMIGQDDDGIMGDNTQNDLTEWIAQVQVVLKDQGLYDGEIDGEYDGATRDILMEAKNKGQLSSEQSAGIEALEVLKNMQVPGREHDTALDIVYSPSQITLRELDPNPDRGCAIQSFNGIHHKGVVNPAVEAGVTPAVETAEAPVMDGQVIFDPTLVADTGETPAIVTPDVPAFTITPEIQADGPTPETPAGPVGGSVAVVLENGQTFTFDSLQELDDMNIGDWKQEITKDGFQRGFDINQGLTVIDAETGREWQFDSLMDFARTEHDFEVDATPDDPDVEIQPDPIVYEPEVHIPVDVVETDPEADAEVDPANAQIAVVFGDNDEYVRIFNNFEDMDAANVSDWSAWMEENGIPQDALGDGYSVHHVDHGQIMQGHSLGDLAANNHSLNVQPGLAGDPHVSVDSTMKGFVQMDPEEMEGFLLAVSGDEPDVVPLDADRIGTSAAGYDIPGLEGLTQIYQQVMDYMQSMAAEYAAGHDVQPLDQAKPVEMADAPDMEQAQTFNNDRTMSV